MAEIAPFRGILYQPPPGGDVSALLAPPKADRLKLKRATRTHLSQVFGLYRDADGTADRAFAAIEQGAPELHGRTSDGVDHRMWRLTDRAALEQVTGALRDKLIYIA